jgi:hypothetical protein
MEDIKKSILMYDFNRDSFNKTIPKIKSIKYENSNTDLNPSYIIINDIKFIYNIVGRFDKTTNLWEWGYVNEDIKNKFNDIRLLFYYGIDTIEQNSKIFKNILINSKIKINNTLNLDIILAITTGFLSNRGFKYIYPVNESENITKYLILKIVE